MRGLAPGNYMLAVFGHSSYGAGFPIATGRQHPRRGVHHAGARRARARTLSLDQGFLIGGWAADFSAASGSGIDVVHVYAYPLDVAGEPMFLGQAAPGSSRPDVAAFFGPQFQRAGSI